MDQRFLIIQLRQLGDILLTTPCISALRQWAPKADLVFLCHPMGKLILGKNAELTELVTYPADASWQEELQLAKALRDRRFTMVVDFMNNPRSAFYAAMSGAPRRIAFRSARRLAYTQTVAKPEVEDYIVRRKFMLLHAAGVTTSSERLTLPWEARDLGPWHRLRELNPVLDTAPLRVALSATHRRAVRRWPLASYAALAERLTRDWGAAVLWLHGPGEEAEVDAAMAQCRVPTLKAPATSFSEMTALMAQMHLFVGNSNGPSHVAVATNIPSLQLHGHTSAVAWCPLNDRHQAIQSPEFGKVPMPGMAAISVDMVWHKLQDMKKQIEQYILEKRD